MKITKAQINAALNSLDSVAALLEEAGVDVVDGVYVTPGMIVDAIGFKNAKTFSIAPKNSAAGSRRVAGAICTYRPDGTLDWVRRSQFTLNGKPAGLFFNGEPVLGYAE